MERERRRGKERGNAVCARERERERDNVDNKSDPALQIEKDGF